jgi:hypothetical protein
MTKCSVRQVFTRFNLKITITSRLFRNNLSGRIWYKTSSEALDQSFERKNGFGQSDHLFGAL